ncbi:hypothetical protein [Marinospirillum alkaliphilum]|uniref:Uncharacterized protein n=1 Tax=Marinospirillum alkaliphilum DSM 21637 TaxID=1122209 RepID=A0A1K1YZV8_9GAMM|nr:hypothetical protein [Marinospirillum alkaliphilum]SFX67383.1 hypothetical protein SAMN02745752_02500 [Marinospirillum alkaliphilum DSM 21637]
MVSFIINNTGGADSPYHWEVPKQGEPVLIPPQTIRPNSKGELGVAAAGMPFNMHEPVDLISPEEQQRAQHQLTMGIASFATGPFFLTNIVRDQTKKGVATAFSVGAGFDAAGQMVQGGEYRPAQSLITGTVAVIAAPYVSTKTAGNIAVGATAAGGNTAVQNTFYQEDRSVPVSAGMGAVFTGVAPFFGQGASNLIQPYVQPSAANAVKNATQTTVENIPSFIRLPDNLEAGK